MKNIMNLRMSATSFLIALSTLFYVNSMAQTQYVDFVIGQATTGCNQIPARGAWVVSGAGITGGTIYVQQWTGTIWSTLSGSSRSLNGAGQMVGADWIISSTGTYRVNGSIGKPGGGFYPTEPNTTRNFTVNKSAVNAFNVGGNSAKYPTVINYYPNATNIQLNNTSTSYTQYKLDIIRTDASGTAIAGLGGYSYTSGLITGTFSTKNLITETANAILTPAYYKVTLSVNNTGPCPAVASQTAFIRMNPPFDFKMTVSGGTGVANRSTNLASPVLTGYASCGITGIVNLAGTPATITDYRIALQEVDCNNPILATPISNSDETWQPAPGGNLPANRNFNTITSGYFAGQNTALNGRCFAVIVEVKTSGGDIFSQMSYFTFCCGTWLEPSPVGNNQNGNLSVNWNMYPNPAHDNVNLMMSSEEDLSGEWVVQVYDITGRSIHQQAMEEGRCTIATSLFTEGHYLCVITRNGVTIGQEKLVIKH